jgi:6-phosphogluconolactonase (cycloisomerase 2 family)
MHGIVKWMKGSVMRRRVTIALATLAGVVSALALAAPATAQRNDHRNNDQRRGNLVFVQLNDINGNSVRVFKRAGDGMLTPEGDFPTGGKGGTVAGAPTDPLQSQGSLIFSNGLLFAVNAGKNTSDDDGTVTVFRVDGTQLHRLQVIDSGGEFPASIAVRDNLVFVANGGGAGSIQGYRLDHGILDPIQGDNRPLGLHNTNPPVFPASIGQVGISPNGKWAFVTMVGGVVDANGKNIINAFRIDHNGVLSDSPVASPSVGGLPFGFTFQTPNRLIISEAGVSAVTTYQRVGQGSLTPVGSAPNGQIAQCWILQVGEFYFGVNTGSNTVSSYRVEPNGQPVLLAPVAGTTDAAPIDPAQSGGFLYVQSSSGGFIAVFQVNSDGTLTFVTNVSDGLPIFDPNAQEPSGMEGIAAS